MGCLTIHANCPEFISTHVYVKPICFLSNRRVQLPWRSWYEDCEAIPVLWKTNLHQCCHLMPANFCTRSLESWGQDFHRKLEKPLAKMHWKEGNNNNLGCIQATQIVPTAHWQCPFPFHKKGAVTRFVTNLEKPTLFTDAFATRRQRVWSTRRDCAGVFWCQAAMTTHPKLQRSAARP